MIRHEVQVNEIGRLLEGSEVIPFLNIGVTTTHLVSVFLRFCRL